MKQSITLFVFTVLVITRIHSMDSADNKINSYIEMYFSGNVRNISKNNETLSTRFRLLDSKPIDSSQAQEYMDSRADELLDVLAKTCTFWSHSSVPFYHTGGKNTAVECKQKSQNKYSVNFFSETVKENCLIKQRLKINYDSKKQQVKMHKVESHDATTEVGKFLVQVHHSKNNFNLCSQFEISTMYSIIKNNEEKFDVPATVILLQKGELDLPDTQKCWENRKSEIFQLISRLIRFQVCKKFSSIPELTMQKLSKIICWQKSEFTYLVTFIEEVANKEPLIERILKVKYDIDKECQKLGKIEFKYKDEQDKFFSKIYQYCDCIRYFEPAEVNEETSNKNQL